MYYITYYYLIWCINPLTCMLLKVAIMRTYPVLLKRCRAGCLSDWPGKPNWRTRLPPLSSSEFAGAHRKWPSTARQEARSDTKPWPASALSYNSANDSFIKKNKTKKRHVMDVILNGTVRCDASLPSSYHWLGKIAQNDPEIGCCSKSNEQHDEHAHELDSDRSCQHSAGERQPKPPAARKGPWRNANHDQIQFSFPIGNVLLPMALVVELDRGVERCRYEEEH